MIRVVIAAWLLVIGAAEAAPNDQLFRARNPQAWSMVTLGATGFVQRVVTDAADLQIRKLGKDGHYEYDAAALDRVRALLRTNADLFGIDAADADHLAVKDGAIAYYDNDTGFVLAAIQLDPAAAGLDLLIVQPRIRMTPKITREAVAARFVGRTYAVRSSGVLPAPLDCNMGGTATRCQTKMVVDTRRVTLTEEDVEVQQGMITFGGAKHLVHCVDLGQEPGKREFRPGDGGPAVPLVLDAVSGKPLATRGATCADVWLHYVK